MLDNKTMHAIYLTLTEEGTDVFFSSPDEGTDVGTDPSLKSFCTGEMTPNFLVNFHEDMRRYV